MMLINFILNLTLMKWRRRTIRFKKNKVHIKKRQASVYISIIWWSRYQFSTIYVKSRSTLSLLRLYVFYWEFFLFSFFCLIFTTNHLVILNLFVHLVWREIISFPFFSLTIFLIFNHTSSIPFLFNSLHLFYAHNIANNTLIEYVQYST